MALSEPFLAQISMFGFNFAPRGWATCAGQLLPISQNTALFALLGTTYGGDGRSNFALPNLQDRAANSFGRSNTGTEYVQGEEAGEPQVTLLESQMPAHNHPFNASTSTGTTVTSGGNELGVGKGGTKQNSYTANMYSTNTGATNAALAPSALAPAGGSLPHNNVQPYLTLNFCIALQGIFPARS
jgi:microcystin-dependent protein